MANTHIRVTDGRRSLGKTEMIAILALLMSLAALAVDLMLPAMGMIRSEFGLDPDSTAVAGLITAYILGVAVTQIPIGILADRFGRKPLLYAGLALYLVGAVASTFAPSLGFLLVARFVWGMGAAGPRALTLAVVRDTHKGTEMARFMSFIFGVFILIPVFAPAIGAWLTDWISWRGTFGFAVVMAIAVGIWSLRLPETLREENRRYMDLASLRAAARLVVTNRVTVTTTLALSVLFGVFLSYIASSEIIFDDVFGRGEQFPLIFGGVAVFMAVGLFTNGWLVGRFGVRLLVEVITRSYAVAAVLLAAVSVATGGVPPFWLFVGGLALLVFFQSILIPNLNTLAMDPMGSVAGMASAIIGTVSTGLAAILGAVIDRMFDGTVGPLSIAFFIAAIVTLFLIRLSGDRRHESDAKVAPATPGEAGAGRRLPQTARFWRRES